MHFAASALILALDLMARVVLRLSSAMATLASVSIFDEYGAPGSENP
jgi:hypothetical protein